MLAKFRLIRRFLPPPPSGRARLPCLRHVFAGQRLVFILYPLAARFILQHGLIGLGSFLIP